MWLCLSVGRQFEDSHIEYSCCMKPKVLLLDFWKSDNTQIEFDHDNKDKEDWKEILSSVFALMCKTQLRISILSNVTKNLTINMIVDSSYRPHNENGYETYIQYISQTWWTRRTKINEILHWKNGLSFFIVWQNCLLPEVIFVTHVTADGSVKFLPEWCKFSRKQHIRSHNQHQK